MTVKIKLLALIVILSIIALPLAGCCTKIDPVTKASSKSFANCLGTAQQMLCNPTDQQKAEAAAILTFLTSGVAIAGIVTNVPITVGEVTTIFGMVQAGGCVLTTDLQLALSWYAALTATLQTQAKAAGKKGLMAPPVINSLYNW